MSSSARPAPISPPPALVRQSEPMRAGQSADFTSTLTGRFFDLQETVRRGGKYSTPPSYNCVRVKLGQRCEARCDARHSRPPCGVIFRSDSGAVGCAWCYGDSVHIAMLEDGKFRGAGGLESRDVRPSYMESQAGKAETEALTTAHVITSVHHCYTTIYSI